MSPKNVRQLKSNASRNKGFRFSPGMIEGSGFFSGIAKSVAKAAAPLALDFIGDKTGQKGITDALKGSADGLIDVAADKMTSGGKLKKGTPEMRERMSRLRAMRKVKGGSILDDIKNGFNRTFNPKLGNQIKDALTSPEAKQVYSGIASAGATALTGNPLAGAVAGQAVDALSGSGLKRRYKKKNILVVGGTLVTGVPQVQVHMNHLMTPLSGGSFKSAGGRLRGGRVRGGSMISP